MTGVSSYVRKATPADRADLLRLAINFCAEGPYRGLPVDTTRLLHLVDHLTVHGGVFVAIRLTTTREWEVVGMLALSILDHPITGKRTASEIAWWMEPVHRGGMLAIRLLATAELWARDQAHAEVIQMIAPASSEVGDLYRRRGYLPLETTWQREEVAA